MLYVGRLAISANIIVPSAHVSIRQHTRTYAYAGRLAISADIILPPSLLGSRLFATNGGHRI